jgi:hypothetical protein
MEAQTVEHTPATASENAALNSEPVVEPTVEPAVEPVRPLFDPPVQK